VPFFFWLDISALIISGMISFSMALITVGNNPRLSTNRFFSLFALLHSLWAFGSLLLRLSLWLKIGNPLFLAELETLFYTLMTFFLFIFTTRYLKIQNLLIDMSIIISSIAIGILTIPLFSHRIIFNPSMVINGSTTLDLTLLGYLVAIIPTAYILCTFLLFLFNRKKEKVYFFPVSIVILMLGFIFGGLLELPFPILSLTNAVCVIILGYVIVYKQILNPLNKVNILLKNQIEEKINELKKMKDKIETRIKEKTLKLKMSQKHQIQSKKIEVFKKFANEIAHDFNNLLTVIDGYIQLLLESYKSKDKLKDDLKEIKMATEQAIKLTKRLLAFARNQVIDPQVVNINTIKEDDFVKKIEQFALNNKNYGLETILIVEDDRMIRDLTIRILKEDGYQVLSAQDAEEAKKICVEYGNQINLLLTDIIMPGEINGFELATQLEKKYPNMRIIYMSGYIDDPKILATMQKPEIFFIQKPFKPELLKHKVRETLNKVQTA